MRTTGAWVRRLNKGNRWCGGGGEHVVELRRVWNTKSLNCFVVCYVIFAHEIVFRFSLRQTVLDW